jgi:hypothetical protein
VRNNARLTLAGRDVMLTDLEGGRHQTDVDPTRDMAGKSRLSTGHRPDRVTSGTRPFGAHLVEVDLFRRVTD